MFKQFETLVDPYPADDAGTPPDGFWRFIWHYSRPMVPWLAIMAVLTAVIFDHRARLLLLHRHAGRLADGRRPRRLPQRARLGARRHGGDHPRSASRRWRSAQALLMFQTSFGTYPMLVRWRAHRQLLGQSLAFFQDEFAGRVSQKVMQTALAVRETVMKLMDVGVYIVTMFIGTAYLFASIDLWMLAALGVWLAAYVAHHGLFRAAPRQDRRGAGRRARPDDRTHRRQLHQHPDGQALRPFHPRAGLCPRRHGRVPGHRPPADAPDHRLHLVGQRHQLAAPGGGRG